MRARRGVLCGLGAAVVLFVGIAALGPIAQWDNWPAVRVTGRLVDARTGGTLKGGEVLTLWSADARVEEDEVERHRKEYAWARRERNEGGENDPWSRCVGPHGFGVTDADGSFEACLAPLWGGSTNAWGCSSRSKDPPEFHGCRALWVRSADGRTAIVDCTQGRWTVVERYRRYALDLDVVPVELGH